MDKKEYKISDFEKVDLIYSQGKFVDNLPERLDILLFDKFRSCILKHPSRQLGDIDIEMYKWLKSNDYGFNLICTTEFLVII